MSNAFRFVKKGVSIAVTTSTILWAVGVGTLAPVAQAAEPGDLIKMDGNTAVYFLGSDNKRYVFPNSKTFNTWYSDFSGVVTVSQSELQSYAIGGNVTYRAGTYLVKITTDPKVYAVEPGGVLRWVESESIATTLWGANWATMVHDVPDAFFVNYTVGSSIASNTYPTGSLIKQSGSDDVYYVDGSQKRMVTSAGLSGNNFDTMFVHTADDAVFNTLGSGASITGNDADIWNVAGGATTTPTPGGSGLTLSVAADTPPATVVSSGTAYNPFLKLNATAAADGDVSITGLTVTRLGLANDSAVSGVGIFDANDMRHGNFVNFSDTKAEVSFSNDPIVVPAGQTVPIWVKLNLTANVQTGTVAVAVTASTDVSTSAAVSGNFPLTGNGSSIILGNVGALTADDVTLSGAQQQVDIGVSDYELSRFRFTAGGNEDVKLTEVKFFLNGTVDDTDLMNFDLVNLSSATVLKTVQANNRFVHFTGLSSIIPEGQQRDFSVRVDTKDGSTRTAQLNIQNDYDVRAYGTETGAGILPTAGVNDATFPIGDTTNRNTIVLNEGTLTVAKASSSPSGDIGIGVQNTVLAEWEVEAKGEDIELQRVDLNIVGTGTNETDYTGTVRLQTGSGKNLLSLSVPGTGDIDELFDGGGVDTQTLSSYHTVKAGTKETLKLVVNTNSGTNPITAGDTPSATIGEIFAKRLQSNNFTTFLNGQTVAGNTLSVTAVTLTVTNNGSFGANTLTAGQPDIKIGSFLLQTNNTEGANVSSVAVQLINAGSVAQADLSNLKIKRSDTGVQLGTTIATPQVGAANNNTFSTSGQLNLAANSTVQIDVYVNTNTAAADGVLPADTLNVRIAANGVSATGATSGSTINNTPAAAVNSSTLTFVTGGSLVVSIDTSGAAASQFLTTGLSGVEMARIKLASTNEAAKVQEIRVRTIRGTGNIASVKLLGTGLATDPSTQLTDGEARFTFSAGSEINVPKDSSRVLTVVVDTTALQTLIPGSLGVIGFGTLDAIGAGSGQRIQESVTGTSFTAAADDGSEAITTGNVVYFTQTTATGSVAPGFYGVTANGGGGAQGLSDNGLSLNGTAATFTAGDIVTQLTATTTELVADGDSDNALAVGDVVYFYDASNAANTGFHVVTTASNANAANINISGAAVAVANGDVIASFANASLPNALVGRVMRYEEVEPVITVAASSPSGTQSPNSDQVIAKFNIKAEGGRDLTWNALTIEKSGSTEPERYVTDFSLYDGGNRIARVANTTVSGGTAAGATLTGSTFEVCSGANADGANDLDEISSAEWNTIQIGDQITLVDTGDNSTTVGTVTARVGDTTTDAACNDGSDTFTIDTTATGFDNNDTIDVRNNRVHFDANQSNTNDVALTAQTITQGATQSLEVRANTSQVRGTVSQGTVTFGVNIPGNDGPLEIGATQIEGLNWRYTAQNGGAVQAFRTEGDDYAVHANTLVY